jgi:hypothetical protein
MNQGQRQLALARYAPRREKDVIFLRYCCSRLSKIYDRFQQCAPGYAGEGCDRPKTVLDLARRVRPYIPMVYHDRERRLAAPALPLQGTFAAWVLLHHGARRAGEGFPMGGEGAPSLRKTGDHHIAATINTAERGRNSRC